MAPSFSSALRKQQLADIDLLDLEPDTDTLLADVIAGLSATPKTLPCKYFYDARGAKLFEQICELEEYYPTRTELGILQDNLEDIAKRVGPDCAVIEPGSGSGIKTRLLLEHLHDPVAYMPIDVARDQLLDYAAQLAVDFPAMDILPVCADFTQALQLPEPNRETQNRMIYFPGSTIGNFKPEEARQLLKGWRQLLGDSGSLLIGVDLKKDPAILEAAYNDQKGITADFNLNLLKRLNRELQADFNLGQFRHHADYDEATGAIRMWLVSKEKQQVNINGSEHFDFETDEAICTEHSHKYSPDDFITLAAQAGWQTEQMWTDENRLFSLWYLQTG